MCMIVVTGLFIERSEYSCGLRKYELYRPSYWRKYRGKHVDSVVIRMGDDYGKTNPTQYIWTIFYVQWVRRLKWPVGCLIKCLYGNTVTLHKIEQNECEGNQLLLPWKAFHRAKMRFLSRRILSVLYLYITPHSQ